MGAAGVDRAAPLPAMLMAAAVGWPRGRRHPVETGALIAGRHIHGPLAA